MEIIDLEFCLIEIGRSDAAAPVRSLLVRLTTDEGLEGWGEAQLDWRADELPARRETLLPTLVGCSAFGIEELATLEPLGLVPLRCAVETACWDLIGRAAGQPLCRLWGGEYRPQIPIAVRLPEDVPQRVAQMARELADQGFHSQILPAGERPQDVVEAVAEIGESGRERVELRIDGQARFDMDASRDLCTALEHAGVQLLVDPLCATELYQLASLARQTSLPVCVWRPIRSAGDVLSAVRCGAGQWLIVDLQRVGGISAARKSAAVAEAAGVGTLLGGPPATGIHTAAMLQLAAATPGFSSSNESAYSQLSDDVLAEPLEISDGMFAVPRGPGLGIEIDRAKIERYQVT